MFGIGWTEMLVLGVVALIVIGPKDLPVLMNRMGKAIASIRRMGSEFQREINKASGLDTITDLRKSITEPLKATAADIRKEFNKPIAGGGVAPSGIIAPKDPKAESVVDEIHAKLGMPAPAPAAAPEPVDLVKPVKPARAKKAAIAVESPAPPEATAPAVKKPRAPRKSAIAAAAAPPDMFASEPQAVAKTPAPRKPRAAKPKPEA